MSWYSKQTTEYMNLPDESEETKTIKVVRNRNYGGFAISKKCAVLMAAKGNKECLDMLERHRDDEGMAHEPIWSGFLEITPRHDPVLIEAIETLGAEKAGWDSILEVEEFAVRAGSQFRYFIHEYDGLETVVIPETIDWVTVKEETENNDD